MQLIKLKNLIVNKISGEWGEEGTAENGIKIIRTTNFTNTGKIDYKNIAYRIISPEKVEKKRVLNGDIIIEKSGGSPNQPVGRVVFFDKDDSIYLTNNFTAILRPNADLIYNKFLFYTLFFLHKRGVTLRYQNKTTGIINLRLDKYLEEKISLPSISDQIKIAKTLSWVEELIGDRKESIDLLDELLQSKFIEMFGDPVIGQKFPYETFGNISKVRQGLQISISLRKNEPGINRYPYITNQFVNGGKIAEYIENPNANVLCDKDDVLMTRTGNTGIVVTDVKGVFHNNFFLIDYNKELLNKTYLVNFLRFPQVKKILIKKASTTTIPDLNHGEFYSVKIPIPPLSLQIQFASIVEKTELIKKDYKLSLAELENLYGSLSQRAFNGELDLSRLDITEELKAHEEIILQYKEQKEEEMKHIEEFEDENLTASTIHAALDWPIKSEVFNTEQIANLLKEKYKGFHFSFEMAYRYLSKRIKNIESYYFYSEELLGDPGLKNEANFKDFFQSALEKESQFIELKQQFYNPKEENFDLQLTADDYSLWKDKKDRSGIYFSIK